MNTSTPAQKFTITLGAGAALRVPVVGSFFLILSCTGPVKVQTETANLDQLLAGNGLKASDFSYLTFTDQSGAANTITYVVSDAEFLYSPQTNTAITSAKAPQSPGFTNTARTVTTTAAQLVGSNTARQYLLIQNKDGGGSIWVAFGATATQANGIKIPPGGYWEWSDVIPTGAVSAIGDIGSNPNVITVEG